MPNIWIRTARTLTICLAIAATASAAQAQVGATFAQQGRVASAGGVAVPDGTYKVTVRYYKTATVPTALYQYVDPAVPVTKGLFTLAVGSKAPLDPAPFLAGDAGWIGIQIGSDPELPRIRMHQVPYALRAESLQCTGCIQAGHLDPAVLAPYAKLADLPTAGDGLTKVANAFALAAGGVANGHLHDSVQFVSVRDGAGDQKFAITKGQPGLQFVGTGSVTVAFDAANQRITIGSVAGGTVTAVTASSPLQSSGGSTPNLSLGVVPTSLGGTGNTSGTAVGFSGALGGDVTGTQGSTTVGKLQGRALAATAPTVGQVLKWDGTQWKPDADTAGGGSTTGTGTANYLARWSSGSALTTGSVFDDGAKVGIGTTAPAEKLDVAGNIKAVGNVNTGGSVNAGGNVTANGEVNAAELCIGGDCRGSWNGPDADSVSPLPRTCPTGQVPVSTGPYQWACSVNCAYSTRDCNNQPNDGCEVNVMTSTVACGECGKTCSSNGMASVSCSAGTCNGTCATGRADCNTDKLLDGCEKAIFTDADNCGGCNNVCSNQNMQTRTCSGSSPGVCNGTCAGGFGDCNGNKLADGCESNLETDENHCGGCGIVCSTNHMTGTECKETGVACSSPCSNGSCTDCNAPGTTLIPSSAFVDPNPPAGWVQCAGYTNTAGDDVGANVANNCLPTSTFRMRIYDPSGTLTDDVYRTGGSTASSWPSSASYWLNSSGSLTMAMCGNKWPCGNTSSFYGATNGTGGGGCGGYTPGGMNFSNGNGNQLTASPAMTGGQELWQGPCYGGTQWIGWKVAFFRQGGSSAPIAACTGNCDAGYADCNNNKQADGCEINTQNGDVANCGTCGTVCSSNNIARACTSGSCNAGTCNSGFADCNTNKQSDGCEINTNTNTTNCGACGNVCSTNGMSSTTCGSGVCNGTCASGRADCNTDKLADGCEINTTTDPDHCAGCGQACSNNHMATRTCGGSVCNGTCQGGWGDCNANKKTDGCETDIVNGNISHCGGCGAACSTNNKASTDCNNNTCVGGCNTGFADCNANLRSDGCEINITTNTSHCGACGVTCSTNGMSSTTCSAGVCNGTCAAGRVDCNGNKQTDGCEINVYTDADNCGGCGGVCSNNNMQTRTCSGSSPGVCNGACKAGYADCNGNKKTDGCEVNLTADTANCGGCGTVCSTNNMTGVQCSGSACSAVCSNGSCTDCNPAGTTLIPSSAFVDPSPPSGWVQCAGYTNTASDDVSATVVNNCLPTNGFRMRIFDPSGVNTDDIYVSGGVVSSWPSSANYWIGGSVTLAKCGNKWPCTNTAGFYGSTNGVGGGGCSGYTAGGMNFSNGNGGQLTASPAMTGGQELWQGPCYGSTQWTGWKVAFYKVGSAAPTGTCTGTCTAGTADCNNNKQVDGCEINIETGNVSNCGACGVVCSTNNIVRACAGGSCNAGTCNAGYADCNANKQTDGCEVFLATNTSHCGGCGVACSSNGVSALSCTSGTCSSTCAAGKADCNGNKQTDGCETDIAGNVLSCGGCGVVCSTNNISRACSGSSCNAGTCNAGFADCNSNKQSDGCETNISSNVLSCGGCGVVCSTNNITRACASNSCNAGTCNAGFADCNGNKQSDGCEINTTNNISHCGGCGQPCSTTGMASTTCSSGTCNGTCAAGRADCNGNKKSDGCEIDTNDDKNNCGGCGIVCPGLQYCSAGVCTAPKRVFVSASNYNGLLGGGGGYSGADGTCQSLANNAGLGGSWKAWVSNSTSANQVSTRFSKPTVRYVRLDGAVVANNWNDLVDGAIQNPINIDQNGSNVGGVNVATGTNYNGAYLTGTSSNNCNSWSTTTTSTSSAYRWYYGRTDQTGTGWSYYSSTYGSGQTCSSAVRRIYCFEQ